VVPSLSPGLAAQRPTPGKLSHKIQPLIPKPREARIRTAANSPKIQHSTLKIQHCFPHPQTNPHPKSTVDLGCEGLIRVENGLRSPLLPTGYRPISGPKIKESNQNQTATHQKIYSASPLIPASRSKCLLPFPSTANEEFQVKIRPIFRYLILPYSTLCQPILPILDPLAFYRAQSRILIHRDFSVQGHSKQFKAIQGFLETFFYFYAPVSKTPSRYDSIDPPGWSLELLWCLDVAPKAFGVGTFARVAVCQDHSVRFVKKPCRILKIQFSDMSSFCYRTATFATHLSQSSHGH
jgi:hypothetical protein